MIHSLLDNDFYAFTMSAVVNASGFGGTNVKYAFRNRTFAVPLAARIDLGELREQVDEVRNLSFTDIELDYLQGLGYFSEDQITDWSFLKLPDVHLGEDHGHLVIEYEGAWQDAIFWETPLLSIVNELYFQQFGIAAHREGNLRLIEKIEYLRARGTLHFMEFGTRRRFSTQWQEHVMHRLLDEIPQLVTGTSNVNLARHNGIAPVGTMAHQLFMVQAALQMKEERARVPGEWAELSIQNATQWVLSEWMNLYGGFPELLTALPDTFTTDEFFAVVPNDLLAHFKTFRQDSGDPMIVGEKIVDHYVRALRTNPQDLKINFSDSLDVRRMSVIEDNFKDVCQYGFGWGTNLTNDLGVEPLAIVIKPSEADGEPCCKLSDDLSKATGIPGVIANYREAVES